MVKTKCYDIHYSSNVFTEYKFFEFISHFDCNTRHSHSTYEMNNNHFSVAFEEWENNW